MAVTTAFPDLSRVAPPALPTVVASQTQLKAAVNPHALSPACSLLLDVVRFSAAILVVVGHLTHPEFHTGFRNRQILGDIAVPVFFVLSGFVIRFITQSRRYTVRDFFIDRAARMYSVMIPAMALTLALSVLCLLLNRTFYIEHWGNVSDHPVSRVLLNLTFLSQSWGHNTIPFINTPFWSLSYECLFYIGYGLFFYLRGRQRIVGLLVWTALAGPQVIFLLPTWCLGCWLYDLYHHLRRTRLAALSILMTAAVCLALAFALNLAGHSALLNAPRQLHQALASLPNPLLFLHLSPVRATMTAITTATFAAVCLLLAILAADLLHVRCTSVAMHRFRTVADGTFAIYLMHYPLMVLAGSLNLFQPHRAGLSIATAAVIVLLLTLAGAPLDLFKHSISHWLNMLIPQPRRFRMALLTMDRSSTLPAAHPRASLRNG